MAKRRQGAQVRQDQSFKGRQFTAEVILWVLSALVPASIAGRMTDAIFQAASNTLRA
jgi:hypothetical protein